MKMKIFMVSALLWLSTYVYSGGQTNANLSIVKNSPLFSFSAEFDCKKGDILESKIIRTGLFCPRYFYELQDAHGNFQAQGITRFFSLGFLFAWGMEIDVHDQDGVIGKIEGQMFTKSRAKFVFYNAGGQETTVAYLNTEKPEFVIASAQNEAEILANLKGKTYGDLCVWEIEPVQPELRLDPRLLKIFSAFASDYHSSFVAPPKVINNYIYYDSDPYSRNR
jgi:hypothetical protein